MLQFEGAVFEAVLLIHHLIRVILLEVPLKGHRLSIVRAFSLEGDNLIQNYGIFSLHFFFCKNVKSDYTPVTLQLLLNYGVE